MEQKLAGQAHLDHLPMIYHADPIGKCLRLLQAMGHQYGTPAEVANLLPDPLHEIVRQLAVQGGEGLVQAQQLTSRRECPGQRNPTLLAF
jgi:hypothetical protein